LEKWKKEIWLSSKMYSKLMQAEMTKELFTTSIEYFTELSIMVLFTVFIFRLIFKNMGFEHLKMISTIIIFTFTLEFTIKTYKAEQNINLMNNIITIQTSPLKSNDKKIYIEKIKKERESISSIKTSNFIFSIGKILLVLMLLLAIIDFIKIFIKNRIVKLVYNKITLC